MDREQTDFFIKALQNAPPENSGGAESIQNCGSGGGQTPILTDTSFPNLNQPFRTRGKGAVVGDQKNGDTRLIHLLEDSENGLAGLQIQGGRGFIGQDQRGITDHGPRNGHPLPLATGQLIGEPVGVVGQPHPAQGPGGRRRRSAG